MTTPIIVPNLTFQPQTNPNDSKSSLIALEDIPDGIKEQVEEVYTTLKTNPGRMHVAFETELELNTYIKVVTSYCKQRPAGVIHFRKSPTRNQPKNEADFRITDVPTKNEADSKAINDAAAKVTKAAKTAATAK